MKFLGLMLVCAMTAGTLTGCGTTRAWVVDFVKDQTVKIVDKQIVKYNEKTIAPKFAEIENNLGHKVDTDADGVWSENEIKTAAKEQAVKTFAEVKDLLLAESAENADKSLTERLKEIPKKSEQFQYLLWLVGAYILSKFGIKVGPKGLQTLRERLEKKKQVQEVNLN